MHSLVHDILLTLQLNEQTNVDKSDEFKMRKWEFVLECSHLEKSFSFQFRHKVRFEGMELPPSRSSSTSDCKSLCLPPLDGPDSPPTPDSVDWGSEASWRPASSSPCSLTEASGVSVGLGLGPVVLGGTGWRERAETEASLRRLLPTLDALLQQLDRVTMASEDLYHVECKLERVQRKRRHKGREREDGGQEGRNEARLKGVGEDKDAKEQTTGGTKGKKSDKNELLKELGSTPASLKKTVATPVPFSKPKPASDPSPLPQSPRPSVGTPPAAPVPASSANAPRLPKTPSAPPVARGPSPVTEKQRGRETLPSTTLPSTSLFNHPAHTTTIPTRKRKRKPPPLKNKVHPT